jgi:hypothetical protein
MSATLGKIHTWLYGQIKIIDERNQVLIKKIAQRDDAEQMIDSLHDLLQASGGPIGDTPIEEALKGQHIHPGLEQLIIKTQTLESKIVELFIHETNDINFLKEIYKAHGQQVAKKRNLNADNIDDLTQQVKDIFLERMPCDRLTQIEKDEHTVRFKRASKLHTEFWDSKSVMHSLYEAWLSGAIDVIMPEAQYKRTLSEDIYIDEIAI